jgi:hypothetical protein
MKTVSRQKTTQATLLLSWAESLEAVKREKASKQ